MSNKKKDIIYDCIIIRETEDGFILKSYTHPKGIKYQTFADLRSVVISILSDIRDRIKTQKSTKKH